MRTCATIKSQNFDHKSCVVLRCYAAKGFRVTGLLFVCSLSRRPQIRMEAPLSFLQITHPRQIMIPRWSLRLQILVRTPVRCGNVVGFMRPTEGDQRDDECWFSCVSSTIANEATGVKGRIYQRSQRVEGSWMDVAATSPSSAISFFRMTRSEPFSRPLGHPKGHTNTPRGSRQQLAASQPAAFQTQEPSAFQDPRTPPPHLSLLNCSVFIHLFSH